MKKALQILRLAGYILVLLIYWGSEVSANENTLLTLNTDRGQIQIKLYDEEAPNIVSQIKKMVQLGIYDSTTIAMASKNFWLQIGDQFDRSLPLLEEQKNAIQTIPYEATGLTHQRGSVSLTPMPDKEADGELAFTIMLTNAPLMDGKQAVFGKVVKGIEILDDVSLEETTETGELISPVRIQQASLLPIEELKVSPTGTQLKDANLSMPSIFTLAVIILISLLGFILYNKVSYRTQVAFLMLNAFVAGFGVLIHFVPQAKNNGLVGLSIFAMMLALFKFMNRFESQKN